jgi:phosphatidate cytidylyltransferase
MKRVLTAAVLIPVVLVIVFKAPLWVFSLAVAGIALLAIHEYLGIVRAYGPEPLSRVVYAMSIIVVLGTFCAVDQTIWPSLPFLPQITWLFRALTILLIFPVIFGVPVVLRNNMQGALSAAAGSAFGVLYLAMTLALLIPLRHDSHQSVLIIFILFSVWSGDTAAYYVGRNFGRHRLAPIVSPKKTWEGAIASVLASVAVAWLVFHFQADISSWFVQPHSRFYTPLLSPARHIGWGHIVCIGVITNVAAQFGDLFESALKRGANVKDSGTLLPGHGGMLDRIDALLFAIPVVWYYANLTGFLQPRIF